MAEWFQQYVRSAVSPSTSIAMRRWQFSVDVRAALPAVRCPVLLLSFHGAWIGPGHGRYLAGQLPNAKLVELPGATDLLFAGDSETLFAHIEEFVTGSRPAPPADRVLATVLYTDIVDSTVQASRLGDRRWSQLLDRHDEVVRDTLRAASGHEVKHTGDGFLATFDGPARGIRCAEAIRAGVGALGIEVRAGLHAGRDRDPGRRHRRHRGAHRRAGRRARRGRRDPAFPAPCATSSPGPASASSIGAAIA